MSTTTDDSIQHGPHRTVSTARPISTEYHTTPGLWTAIYSQEYDGAPDSRHPVGMGRTEAEAIADLKEKDDDR